jgi:hypothetical protein
VAGLPARILAAKAIAAGEEPSPPITLTTLSGLVGRGFDRPETLANAIHLGDMARPTARAVFEDIKEYIPGGSPTESFDDTLLRVRQAHDSQSSTTFSRRSRYSEASLPLTLVGPLQQCPLLSLARRQRTVRSRSKSRRAAPELSRQSAMRPKSALQKPLGAIPRAAWEADCGS